MKQIGICLLIALALSGIVLGVVWGGVGGVVGAAFCGASLGAATGAEAVRRDRRVRMLVVTALDADASVVHVKLLAETLGTPDVVKARTDHLGREAAMLAQRYANGDAGDY